MGARRCCSGLITAAVHRPSSSFPTWTLAHVWVQALGALVSRASCREQSAEWVTLGSLHQQVEAQPHTNLRDWGQNCASGCGDENGIVYRRSQRVLMVVHLQSQRDQRAQAKGATVVVPPVALALAYCARKNDLGSVLANCVLCIRG
jgi:hypothetical protein